MEYLKIVGVLSSSCCTQSKRTKSGPQTQESVFVGSALHNKAYRFFVISEQDKDFVLSLEDLFSLKIIFFYTSSIWHW